MKRSDSLRLGWAYAHLHQVLAAEKELLEVTFHYGMGVRVHLDTYQLGIRHGKELLDGFLNKRPVVGSLPVFALPKGNVGEGLLALRQ